MAVRDRGIYRGGGGFRGRFAIGATCVSGTPMMRATNVALASEVIPVTTTSATDFVGITLEDVTYVTAQGTHDGFPGYRQSGEEGTVGLTCDPLQVVKFRVSGSATTGAALGTAENIITTTGASATGLVITANVNVDMSGGLICGRTGANAGQVRKQTTYNAATDTNVIVAFPNDIAVGDTFLRVPWSKHILAVQHTGTDFREADGTIATGTGAEWAVVDVDFDIIDDEIAVYCVARDSWLNAYA